MQNKTDGGLKSATKSCIESGKKTMQQKMKKICCPVS